LVVFQITDPDMDPDPDPYHGTGKMCLGGGMHWQRYALFQCF